MPPVTKTIKTCQSNLTRYRRLVRQRKADRALSKYGFTNPTDTSFDGKHLGSYAHWAGDLNADVLVVYPDFRCVEKFCADLGRPVLQVADHLHPESWKPHAHTFLLQLLRANGWDIGTPDAPLPAGVFLADAVPFCGLRKASMRINRRTTGIVR